MFPCDGRATPRLLFSLPHAAAVHPGTQFTSSAKSFPLTLFADPRHLTPFMSHLYKNVGGRGTYAFSVLRFPLSPFLSHHCPLFCTFLHSRKLNPTVFNRFRTLWGKHPGGGGANEIADREEEK